MKRVFSNVRWEKEYGYCRAIEIGNTVELTGTVAANSDGSAISLCVKEQTQFILEKIESILKEFKMDRSHIFRTRMFVTDIKNDYQSIGETHGLFFKDGPPTTTMVEVSGLIAEEFKIEIEASAYRA